MKPFVILVAVFVGAFRPALLLVDFNAHVDASYQAIAHLLVGGLIGAWWTARPLFVNYGGRIYAAAEVDWMILTAGSLTAIEIVCAAIKIIGGH